MSWRAEQVANVEQWTLAYAGRRYGAADLPDGVTTAWKALLKGAYQYHWAWDIKAKLDRAPAVEMAVNQQFDASGIALAWGLIVDATVSKQLDASIGPLRYDIVDFGRQTLVNMFSDLHTMFSLAYMKTATGEKPLSELDAIATAMMKLLADIDQLLATDVNFLLGVWIADARNSVPISSSFSAQNNAEFNARNQITMWGPDQNIEDYASKEWAGLVKDYYGNRWELFVGEVQDAVRKGIPFNQTPYQSFRFSLESIFSATLRSYPITPEGDTIAVAESLSTRYLTNSTFVAEHFVITQNSDLPGHNLFGAGVAAWNKLPGQVAWLCLVNPTCVGFNSDGYLKNSTGPLVASAGTVFFLRR